MMNKSYRRVPSILSSATNTFSTPEEKQTVKEFEQKLKTEDKFGSLQGTFDSIYGDYFNFKSSSKMCLVQIDKNIAWREANQQKIVDYIKKINGGDDSSSALTSLSLGALLLTLN